MLNLPVPYQNELIYSAVARAGVYYGIVSPKQLLDAVFNDRKIVATLDLPCHLGEVSNRLKKTGRYSIEELIYKHTLFPLYAPFITEERKNMAIELMSSRSQGAVHLMLGVAASRIQGSDHLRYCSVCAQFQSKTYGDYFWDRNWYLPKLSVCPSHGPLTIATERIGTHRHQFHPLRPSIIEQARPHIDSSEHLEFARIAAQILNLPPSLSPSFQQWTIFYRNLASDLGHCRGKHIIHADIHHQLNARLKSTTLAELNLSSNISSDTCWLKGIFRKHRKAFSYLEHIAVWLALLKNIAPAHIIEYASRIKIPASIFAHSALQFINQNKISTTQRESQRKRWLRKIKHNGASQARKAIDGASLYAWLYRHDQAWLLACNLQRKIRRASAKTKIDWASRDRECLRELRNTLMRAKQEGPRRSVSWFLKTLPKRATIEKNLYRLPLVKLFLMKHAETITAYQLRRIHRVFHDLVRAGIPPKKWIIVRKAGLRDQRLPVSVQIALHDLTINEELLYANHH
jgi:Tn7-like transposition protein D/TniQ